MKCAGLVYTLVTHVLQKERALIYSLPASLEYDTRRTEEQESGLKERLDILGKFQLFCFLAEA